MVKVAVHRQDDKNNIITLLEDIQLKWKERELTVPAGFRCDGCSVPRFLWDTVSPQLDPCTLRGAVAHDYLYRNTPEGWSREEADLLFYDCIIADGLPPVRAKIAYWGVRLCGKSAWRENAA